MAQATPLAERNTTWQPSSTVPKSTASSSAAAFVAFGFLVDGPAEIRAACWRSACHATSCSPITSVSAESAPIFLEILFSTSLPRAVGTSLLIGFLRSSVALSVGPAHAGLNLYNNGFAAVLVPVITAIQSITKPQDGPQRGPN